MPTFTNEPPIVGTGPYQVVEWETGNSSGSRGTRTTGVSRGRGRGHHPALRRCRHHGPGAEDRRSRLRPRRDSPINSTPSRRSPTSPRSRAPPTATRSCRSIRRATTAWRRAARRPRSRTSPSATRSATRSTRSASSRRPRRLRDRRLHHHPALPYPLAYPPVTAASVRHRGSEAPPRRSRLQLDANNQRLDKDKKPINLRLILPDSETSWPTNAQFLVNWFGELGITVDANVDESGR